MNFIKKSIFIILVSFFFSFSAKAEVNVFNAFFAAASGFVKLIPAGVSKPSKLEPFITANEATSSAYP